MLQTNNFKSFYPWSRINHLLDTLSPYRRPIVICSHIFIFVLSNYLAFYIRFEGEIPSSLFNLFLRYLPLLLFFRIGCLLLFKLDRGLWRYVGVADLIAITAAITFSSILFFLTVNILLGITIYPRSVHGIDGLLNVISLGGIRLIRHLHRLLEHTGTAKKKVIIVGAGDAGEMLVRDIRRNPHYYGNVVGFIDEDPNKKGFTINGVSVLGTFKELPRIVEQEAPDEFILAIPSASSEKLEATIKELRRFAKPIKKVPGLWNILTGRSALTDLEPMKPEDILFRPPVYDESLTQLRDDFANKRVMITGAAGSIGSELTRQIAALRPSKLILFEQNEAGLHRLSLQLGRKFPKLNVKLIIGDITDIERVSRTLEEFSPETIFHAAAYKHVPLMEHNPSEAFKVNVIGTKILAEKARDYKVNKFILISTDKAVNPISVMGKTKNIAEGVLRFLSNNQSLTNDHSPSTIVYATVRFGNVLESSGSVVPLFVEQIKSGGPLTVTDPEVSRYFMTVTEAVLLILRASNMTDNNCRTFVLDMQDPVKILDLAKRLIELYGYVPGKDIEIAFTGLRPGEKLHEQLFSDEETTEKTDHTKILQVNSNPNVPKASSVDELINLLSAEHKLIS